MSKTYNSFRDLPLWVEWLVVCAVVALGLVLSASPEAKAEPPAPLPIYTGFNVSAPGANTDISGTALEPKRRGAWRITVALTNQSVFNMTATDGSATHVWGLNSSTALNAADVYTFTVGVDPSLDYNFQVETNGVIEYLLVEEVQDGAL